MLSFRLCTILLLLFTLPQVNASGQIEYQDKDEVFLAIYEHIKNSQPKGISKDYFKVADAEMFFKTTMDHCNGVVVDKLYLSTSQLKDALFNSIGHTYKVISEGEFREVEPTMLGLYQPSGWTGIAQSLMSLYEMKYNGYLILAEPVSSSNMSTVFHEAIHCFAEAIGRTDLDEDKYEGPSFSSDLFLKIIKKLDKNEENIEAIIRELSKGIDQRDELDRFWKRHELARNDFFIRNEVTTYGIPLSDALEKSGALHHAMGGKADWDGYEAHIRRLFDEAKERGKIASSSEPKMLKGEELKISIIQCPQFSSSYELRAVKPFGGDERQPGQVDVSGTMNKTHIASCDYAVRGRENLSFSMDIYWMESSDGLHHWCDRQVGNSSFYTESNDTWRGPYTPIFPFGVTADQVYAHQEVVAKIVISQYEKGFIRSYLGWSEVVGKFNMLFDQILPYALPCEKR